MNTTDLNYRETLEAAALGYLQRHQAKHLGDEQNLFNLGVAFLINSLSADKTLAECIVARAFVELQAAGERRYLDVSMSNGHTAVITDPASGIAHSVPVALICQLVLDHPERRRLRAAP